MDTLLAQVEAARRRLVMEQFVRRLVWSLFATLLVAAAAIAAPKVFLFEDLPVRWAEGWLIGAGVAGFAIAGVWTMLQRRNALDAAMEIDQRFELRERIASSLSLSEDVQQTEAGRALLGDAVRSIDRIDVPGQFPVRPTSAAWLPLAPAVLAFCLMMFVGNREASSNVDQGPTPEQQKEQVKKSLEDLRKKIAKKAAEAEKKGLKDAEGLLKQIEKGTNDLKRKDEGDRKKSVVKLNKLSDEIQKKRQAMGDKDALQKQLEGMKDLGAGPAEKAVDALKQGEWDKAIKEINKIKDQLAKGKMSPKDQKKLAEQLDKMQKKMQDAAKDHQKKMDDLKKQIEQQKQQGNQQQANKLQQKLDQMQQNQQQMNQMQKMAQQMQQAQQAMQQGNQQQAAQKMQQIADQLQKMQQQDAEMEMLDGAMEQIDAAKQQMGCQQCQGNGCQECQGQGQGQGQGDKQGNKPGMGMGKGKGKGPRPDEKNPTNLRDSRVRHKPKGGASVITGQVKGPNVKGNVMQSVKEELASDSAEEAEALTEERLPRSRREHAKEYLSKIREDL